MWAALQHAEWVTILATSRWLYGLVSVAHYVALFSCVGTIVLLDLRILGVAERNQGLLEFAEQLRPWTWIGSGAAVVSGFLLFATEAGDYAAVTPFHVKMLIVALALISALAIEWSVPKWNRAPVIPVTAKLLALISIALWLGAILAAVEIAALTGLG
jgi:hypothetical protein